MNPDLLDDLLDRSAPATRAPRDADVSAMIAEARAEVPRPRRARRIAITSGTLALLLAGGAGVAAATDGFTWAPWAQNPVGAVAFTMSTGFQCELRFSEYRGGADAAFIADVNRSLEDWHRSTDVVAEAEPLLPEKLAHLDSMADEAADDPEADMSALSPEERADEIVHRAWAREWLAWDLVVSDLEAQALRSAGFPVPDERFVGSERSGQIQCFDEHGEPYVPGDDS